MNGSSVQNPADCLDLDQRSRTLSRDAAGSRLQAANFAPCAGWWIHAVRACVRRQANVTDHYRGGG